MLVIAHRLSTVAGVDRVIVLKGGVVVEEGAPGDLAARPDGIFSAMLRAQQVSDPGAATAVHVPAVQPAEAAPAAMSPHGAAVSLPLTLPVPMPPSETADPAVDNLVARASATAPTAAAAAAAAATKPTRGDSGDDAPPVVNMRARLWELQREDWKVLVCGVFGALVAGAIQPLVSLIYGGVSGLVCSE